MTTYLPHLVAVAVGAGLTVQIGMNATVGRVAGSPLWGAIANFAIGLVLLVASAVAVGARYNPGSASQVPVWAWFGGALGAAYVASVTVLGPRLGGLALLGLVLAGQLIAALVVDQYGVLGYPRIPITPVRLLGAVLLVVGTLLIVRR